MSKELQRPEHLHLQIRMRIVINSIVTSVLMCNIDQNVLLKNQFLKFAY